MFLRYMKYLPPITFAISTTSFLFQVTVLNPWHKQISNQLTQLDQSISKILDR